MNPLAEFLDLTSDDDKQFLGSDELYKLPETLCAMSNSLGGWAVLGARRNDDDTITVTGIDSLPLIVGCDIHDLGMGVFAVRVEPLNWYRKPVTHNGQVYRRVEGENIISGAWARSLMADRDFSRDDYPVTCALDSGQVNAFRNAVTARDDSYRYFTRDEFLRRTGIYSGKYLTFAGALMFGDCMNVRTVLHHNGRTVQASAHSIWSAYTCLLPRLTRKLSGECTAVFREAVINALLHSDYSTDTNINITITSGPPTAIIDNPGLVRRDIRNNRLKRMFDLAGIIHAHTGAVTLKQDMLNFRTSTAVALEGMPEAVML